MGRGAGLRGARPSVLALLIDARLSVTRLLGCARLQVAVLQRGEGPLSTLCGAGLRSFSTDAPAERAPAKLNVYIRREVGGATVAKVKINADADVADLVKMAAAEVLPGVASGNVIVSRIDGVDAGAKATPLTDLEETVGIALHGCVVPTRIVVSPRTSPHIGGTTAAALAGERCARLRTYVCTCVRAVV